MPAHRHKNRHRHACAGIAVHRHCTGSVRLHRHRRALCCGLFKRKQSLFFTEKGTEQPNSASTGPVWLFRGFPNAVNMLASRNFQAASAQRLSASSVFSGSRIIKAAALFTGS